MEQSDVPLVARTSADVVAPLPPVMIIAKNQKLNVV